MGLSRFSVSVPAIEVRVGGFVKDRGKLGADEGIFIRCLNGIFGQDQGVDQQARLWQSACLHIHMLYSIEANLFQFQCHAVVTERCKSPNSARFRAWSRACDRILRSRPRRSPGPDAWSFPESLFGISSVTWSMFKSINELDWPGPGKPLVLYENQPQLVPRRNTEPSITGSL